MNNNINFLSIVVALIGIILALMNINKSIEKIFIIQSAPIIEQHLKELSDHE